MIEPHKYKVFDPDSLNFESSNLELKMWEEWSETNPTFYKAFPSLYPEGDMGQAVFDYFHSQVHVKHSNFIINIFGTQGKGKSTVARSFAKITDPTFTVCPERIMYYKDQLVDAVGSLNRGQDLIIDEPDIPRGTGSMHVERMIKQMIIGIRQTGVSILFATKDPDNSVMPYFYFHAIRWSRKDKVNHVGVCVPDLLLGIPRYVGWLLLEDNSHYGITETEIKLYDKLKTDFILSITGHGDDKYSKMAIDIIESNYFQGMMLSGVKLTNKDVDEMVIHQLKGKYRRGVITDVVAEALKTMIKFEYPEFHPHFNFIRHIK